MRIYVVGLVSDQGCAKYALLQIPGEGFEGPLDGAAPFACQVWPPRGLSRAWRGGSNLLPPVAWNARPDEIDFRSSRFFSSSSTEHAASVRWSIGEFFAGNCRALNYTKCATSTCRFFFTRWYRHQGVGWVGPDSRLRLQTAFCHAASTHFREETLPENKCTSRASIPIPSTTDPEDERYDQLIPREK